MQVILLERVGKLGDLGDSISVKSGFGRNYLIPYGKAVPATKDNVAQFELRRAELEAAAADADDEVVNYHHNYYDQYWWYYPWPWNLLLNIYVDVMHFDSYYCLLIRHPYSCTCRVVDDGMEYYMMTKYISYCGICCQQSF